MVVLHLQSRGEQIPHDHESCRSADRYDHISTSGHKEESAASLVHLPVDSRVPHTTLSNGAAQLWANMDVKNLKDYLHWLYYQYLLITGIYVLEPWEQSIFNTVLLTMVAMIIYTSYVFVPIHVRLAFEFFSGLCGGQPESTVALMN
ncbi:serine palmitoyltransferase small subunit B isoform X1 [Arapaima gigas]